MRRRGKIISIAALIGAWAILVLGATVLVARAGLESWYLHKIEHGERGEQSPAARKLARIASERCIRSLVELLRGPEPEDSMASPITWAFEALVLLEDDAVPILLAALDDEDPTLRARVVRVLGLVGDKSPHALPTLERALTDEAAEVRLAAARCFHRHVRSPVAPSSGCATCAPRETIADSWPAFEALVAGLRDENASVRHHLAVAIGNMGPRASPAVPELIRLLADEEISPRLMAARALKFIGPAAASALPPLLDACNHEDPDVRSYAVEALAAIAPDDPRVRAAIKVAERDEETRLHAQWARQRFNRSQRTGAPE